MVDCVQLDYLLDQQMVSKLAKVRVSVYGKVASVGVMELLEGPGD